MAARGKKNVDSGYDDFSNGGRQIWDELATADKFELHFLAELCSLTSAIGSACGIRRLSVRGLNRLRPGSSLRTLAVDHDVRVESRRSTPSGDVISVDGVDVVAPGLFYARNIAVHGLKGFSTGDLVELMMMYWCGSRQRLLGVNHRRLLKRNLIRNPISPSPSPMPLSHITSKRHHFKKKSSLSTNFLLIIHQWMTI
ncbi:hypothetical protein DM860_006005 [Cuscuta australis]|uniref:Uncharacterized protein n=1 Tax=Cuscuta australis TaxID=267555 RepID=A0A328DNT9_9ASTE|nr:hypothetical protein DM860_006005 [Cuscuta australis]